MGFFQILFLFLNIAVEGIQQRKFLFQCLKDSIFNITDLKYLRCALGLPNQFQALSAPECRHNLFKIVRHYSSAISAANFAFQWEVHAAHQYFMAVALYDKLRFFKFFTTYDCFMGSLCNVLLPFGNTVTRLKWLTALTVDPEAKSQMLHLARKIETETEERWYEAFYHHLRMEMDEYRRIRRSLRALKANTDYEEELYEEAV